MQPLEEKDSSPLEDTEITRLIKVSRELGYKKQDKIPERNLENFKPISITQIATASDFRQDESNNETESAASTETASNDNMIKSKESYVRGIPIAEHVPDLTSKSDIITISKFFE